MIDLDLTARRALGIQHVLDSLSPATPYGAARVRRPHFFSPSEKDALLAEWRNVAFAMLGLTEHPEAYARLRRVMGTLRDIQGTLRRLSEPALSEVELFELKRFLLQLAEIAPIMESLDAGFAGLMITPETAALSLLDPEGKRTVGFAVGGEKGSALWVVREEKRVVELALRTAQDEAERETLHACRRFLAAREEEEALLARATLTEALRPHQAALLADTDAIGRLDYTIARAEWARAHGAVMPSISESSLCCVGLRNPETQAALAETGRAFTPVTLEAPVGATVITGANMGGKSVALRTVAQAALLCQAGFFVCAETAALPLFDAVHVVAGDLTDAAAGLSSFGGEVLRIQAILDAVACGAFCLVALDEPARGTNPHEGAALVKALVKALNRARAVTLVATHYDGVAAFAAAHYRAAGLRDIPEALPPGDPLQHIARHMNYGLERVENEAEAPREALAIVKLLGLAPGVVADMERFGAMENSANR